MCCFYLLIVLENQPRLWYNIIYNFMVFFLRKKVKVAERFGLFTQVYAKLVHACFVATVVMVLAESL